MSTLDGKQNDKTTTYQESTKRDYYLTSTAIPYRSDGFYTYDEAGLLVPHEMLRRLMIMLQNAVKDFDLIRHPWKILALSRWYVELFFPATHEHHDLEEQILFPEYKAKGAVFPDKITSDHVTLISLMEAVRETITSLQTIVETGGEKSSSIEIITEKTTVLKEQVQSLVKHMLEHLQEEEEIWPPIFRQFGQEFYAKVEAKIVKKVLSTPGDVPKNVLVAVLQSVGHFPSGKLPSDIEGWGSEKFIRHFESSVPYPVRVLLVPSWDKKYNKYKSMIVSCTGDVDTKAYVRDPGCQCVIS